MKPIRSFQNRGLALVIVLIMLMLLSGLLVAFLGRVGSERVASKSLAQSFEAKQAYDTAVNVVMSQIREATRNANGTRAWASQPGVIWTFSDLTATDEVYKLYSADIMKMPTATYNITDPTTAKKEAGMEDPKVTPKGYVDLNEPILVPMPGDDTLVEAHYPIVNPYADRKADGTPHNKQAGRGIVEGFIARSFTHPSGKKTKFGTGPQVDVLSLPMRVKWLYQLKDGTMATANSVTGAIPGATKDNPPIARFGFWTDDESSKINVNTAGEYTYWDTPYATAPYESGKRTSLEEFEKAPNPTTESVTNLSLALGLSQPAVREWQRFPGHPATTNLSPVFRWLAPLPKDAPSVAMGMTDLDFKEAIYRLSPRLMDGLGSSKAGSRNVSTDIVEGTLARDYRVPKRDRLFATLDEYWFRPDRSGIDGKGLYNVFFDKTVQTTASPFVKDLNLTPEALERLRFFVTANSRAPELTLWGTPRVSMWPVHQSTDTGPAAKRSPFDELIAFCSTIAKKSYYFTRYDPWSPTNDFELASAGRNKQLVVDYLGGLAKRNVPGTRNSFAKKYSASVPGASGFTAMDQVLLSIFDYVRSTNLVDSSLDVPPLRNSYGQVNAYPNSYTPSYSEQATYKQMTKPNLGSGQVVPTVRYSGSEPAIKGFGRFVTLGESGLLIYLDDEAPITGWDDQPPTGTKGTDYIQLRILLLSEMFTPSPGYPAMAEGYAYSVKEQIPLTVEFPELGGDRFSVDLANNGGALLNYVEVDPYRIGYGRFFTPTRGLVQQFFYDPAQPTSSADGVPEWRSIAKSTRYNKAAPPAGTNGGYDLYPFFSKMIYVKKKPDGGMPKTIKVNKSSLLYTFYPLKVSDAKSPPVHPPADQAKPIQKISVEIPEFTIDKLPVKDGLDSIAKRLNNILTNKSYKGSTGPKDDFPDILGNQDNNIVRTVEASGDLAKGDLRVIAALANISATTDGSKYWGGTWADENTDYTSKTKMRIHNFRSGWGWTQSASTISIVAGADERDDRASKWPKRSTLRGGALSPSGAYIGDIDRGLPKYPEGAYINKPDEGNVKNGPIGGGDEGSGRNIPYFLGNLGYEEVGAALFTPNRMISSPVMFGSLPTGAAEGRPWETLLFSPPLSESQHRGYQQPRDHYLLDLFTMPVVEPYAISEPLSTAGKINLNSRLAPFGYVKQDGRGYIERTTGLHAVLKGMKIAAIDIASDNALHRDGPFEKPDVVTRMDLNPYETIEKVINPRLDTAPGYFRSATEICELDLLMSAPQTPNTQEVVPVPGGATLIAPGESARAAYWKQKALTGDNQRERPYSMLYPRLTTKSNVFTVHIWAQSLTKNPGTSANPVDPAWGIWDDTKDRVTGEYRGSTMIERYIDQNDPALLGTQAGTQPYDISKAVTATGDLERYYRFRILNSKRFTAQ